MDSITYSFPHMFISSLHDQQTYQKTKKINLQLNDNDTSIKTTFNKLCILSLSIPKPSYNNLKKTKFGIPTNQGPFPYTYLPTNNINSLQTYNLHLSHWKPYRSTKLVLTHQLLDAVPNIYTT